MARATLQRKGAIRKTSKKPAVGSGGQVRRGLEGKGPTPKAKDRPYHKAHKQAARAEREEAKKPRRRTTKSTDAEWVAGRNSVLEVLRAGVPVNGVYVAEGAERDGRLRDAFALAAESGISPARGDPRGAGPDDRRGRPPGPGRPDPGVRVLPRRRPARPRLGVRRPGR